MTRGELNWVVTWPKPLLLKVVFGGPNFGRLNRLKNSARISAWNDSLTIIFFINDQSRFLMPSRKQGKVRAEFPNWKGGAVRNGVANNEAPAIRAERDAPSLQAAVGRPTISGRSPPPCAPVVWPVSLIAMGYPLWKVESPENCQCPRVLSST